MAASFSACWNWDSLRFCSVTSRARIRTLVILLPSRIGAYSRVATPWVPSSRENGVSNRWISPWNAAANLSRTTAAASAARNSKMLRFTAGVTSAPMTWVGPLDSRIRPSRSTTTIASGTASMSSRRLRSAAPVAASESISDRVWLATSFSSSAA